MVISSSSEDKYDSVNEMWESEFGEQPEENGQANNKNVKGSRIGSEKNWYEGSRDYWDNKPATVEGVLEGYGEYSEMEIDYSKKILLSHLYMMP